MSFELPKELPFSLTGPRYDQSTFLGRFMYFQDIVDPRNAFKGQADVDSAKSFLQQYERGALGPAVSTTQLWEARKVIDGTCHSDTKQLLPPFLRSSFFLYANVPICFGMILSRPTPANLVFWQWVNQSYNATFNYGTRSIPTDANVTEEQKKKADEEAMYKVGVSYAGAVVVAGAVSLGLNAWVRKVTAQKRFGPIALYGIQIFVPVIATALAGATNATMMRWTQTQEGLDVYDEDGVLRGRSRTAGIEGLAQVAISRMVLPVPILLVPPIILSGLEKISFMKRFMALNMLTSASVSVLIISGCIMGALPAAIAVFPQTVTVDASHLEPEFHNLKRQDGSPVVTLTYNKGM